MDKNLIIETADAVEETSSFVTELAKSFAISAATTAGFMGGLMAVGYVKKKIDERAKAKKTVVPTTEKTATAN
jgi:hypothetical protein